MDFDQTSDPEDENFDWLDGLESDDADAEPDLIGDVSFDPFNPDEEQPADEEAPDWLSSIREAEGTDDAPPPGSGEETGSEGGDPEWLDNIRTQHADELGEEPPGESEGSFLDRIQDLKTEDQTAQAEEVADWLSGIDSGSLPSSALGDESSDDWLTGLDSGSLSSDALAGETTDEEPTADWLSGLGESQPESGEEASEFLSEFGGEQKPDASGQMDWLTELGGDEADESPTEVPDFFAETPDEAEDEAGSPEWFADFGDEETEHEDGTDEWFAEVASESAEDEAGPDWLGELGGQEELEAPAEPDDEALPDWLQGVADDAATAPTAFTPESLEEEQFPDWEGGPPTDASAGIDEEFPDLPKEPGEASVPSWLEELQDGAPDLSMPGGVPAFEELTDIAAFTPDEDPSSILEPTNLPDWLTQASPTALVGDEPPAEEGVEEGGPAIEEPPPAGMPTDDTEIAPAELPSWLQAIRPVEAVAPSAEEVVRKAPTGEAETVGPLAGLKGILPAEPEIVYFGKPPVPITDISVTPSQQNYTKLLQAMVISEEEALPAKKRALALPQQILRWLTAIVLFISVFVLVYYPVTTESILTEAPPAEISKIVEMINGLSAGDAVLVAFEYQPGLSGELEAASAGVINHLVEKGAQMVLFSTQPTGPGLAKNLLQNLEVESESYTSLGYLSGGSAALLNFATDPRAAIPTVNENGVNLWDQAPLADIDKITDFRLVLVLTDDPDTARSWVEQIQPSLEQNSTPLLMVVSAQAEPLVQPYYQNSQISGLLGGLSGGAYYESLTNQANLALNYWDVYSTGLTISVVIISLGGLVNYVRALLSARRKGSRQ